MEEVGLFRSWRGWEKVYILMGLLAEIDFIFIKVVLILWVFFSIYFVCGVFWVFGI